MYRTIAHIHNTYVNGIYSVLQYMYIYIYSGTSLIWTTLGQIKERGVLISEVVKYTNVAFGTGESVLFMEVSLIS